MAPRNLFYDRVYDRWNQAPDEDPILTSEPGAGRFYSSPSQFTGGFGPDGRGPFQGRTGTKLPPSPVQGSSYTHDPLVPDPGPRQRRTTPTGGDPGNPAVQVQRPAGPTYSPPSAPGPPGPAGGMPGAQVPSPTGQPARPSLWSRATDYLSEPAFPRDEYGQEKPMSRLDMLGEMLGSAGRAIGTAKPGTNLLFAGLTGANQGRQDARKYENEQIEQATNNWYKRLTAQAAMSKAQRPSSGTSSEFERNVENLVRSGKITPDRGQELLLERSQSLATENKAPTTAEAAALQAGMSPEEVFQLKNRPSEIELRRLGLSEEAGRRAEEAAARSGQQFNLTSRRLDLQEERERRTAAEAAEGRALPERNRQLVNRVAEAVEGGGWETVTPEDKRAYNRVFRELATPRREIDPMTGNVSEIQPDVTDLPVPPGYGGVPAGRAPPQPGISQPARVMGREQTQAAGEARRVHDEGLQAIDRVNELLDQSGPSGRMMGDQHARLKQAVASLTTLLGGMANAGVMQPSDIGRFEGELGGITGPAAAAGAAVGYEPARAALEELKVRLERHLQNRLPKVTSQEEALAMPPGMPFLLPSGRVGVNPGG